MEDPSPEATTRTALAPYLSPLAVWALSVGSAIGWGSLVVTAKTYLSQAGPAGSVLGLLIGLLMMVMVSVHFHFLGNLYPGTGGLYNYVKHVFGFDRAFLLAWFLFLVYISIFWANATSIPLFARYFLGGAFSFGHLYTIFGYDVYLGEAVVTLVAICLIAWLCARSKVATARAMVALVLLFCCGIAVCFVACMAGRAGAGTSMAPAFAPGGGEFRQVVRIGFLSPWAFIGFESVSHSAAEYRFSHRRLFGVLVSAAAVVTALYVAIVIMSVSAYPEGCSSWLDYIGRLDEFEGIEGLPAFYAAWHYMGDVGVHVLMASLMALVLSSLIGMLRAVSRLCYSVAQDHVLPARFAELSDRQIPVRAILLAVAVSLPIPFLGRTTIGWIVDTTTIGATIVYGFSAVATFVAAGRAEGARVPRAVGAICLPILFAFLVFLLLPGVFADHTIETETYALLIVWSLAGLVYFNWVIRNDGERRFGKALIVWVAFLAFVVLISTTLSERLNEAREDAVVNEIDAYIDAVAERRVTGEERVAFLARERRELHDADSMSVLVVVGMFGVSIAVLTANYRSMRTWERKAIAERDEAHAVAFTDPLTGVKSKHAFAVAEGEMETRIVDGDAGEFGVVVCDVNGLKRINDTLGHKAGDDYIRAGCGLLCEHFDHSPVFRVGGDEFVVLLEGRDYDRRHEIMRAADAEVEGNIGSDRVVISLGLADFDPARDVSFHEVFQRADEAMYERKMELKAMGAVVRD